MIAGTQEPSADISSAQIGYELVGPIIQRWLLGLHQYMAQLEDEDTVFLFCARAGHRIRGLYEVFLEGRGIAPAQNRHTMWVSRIAACKGTFKRQPRLSSAMIAREYDHWPLAGLIEGLLQHNPDILARIDLTKPGLQAHGLTLPEWITSTASEAAILSKYLADCGDAFDDYLGTLTSGAKQVVLIDSGWQGSTQGMLTHAYPSLEWKGLYFGRILSPLHDHSIAGAVIGIMFESERYRPEAPQTAFVLHRHLIESLLEPNAGSIEEIPGGKFKRIAAPLIDAVRRERPDDERDPLYLQARAYLRDNATLPISEIERRYQAAMRRFARMLVTPTREEALALKCKERSADFGKRNRVPVLLTGKEDATANARERIGQSLWPQGQIALEYEGAIAREMQLRSAGMKDDLSHFDPLAATQERWMPGEAARQDPEEVPAPLVSIVTRTKNRPVLLSRAAESVAAQTWTNYVWVVVNDGGDEATVRQVIEASPVDRQRILLINNPESLGMEAASNAGVRAAYSDYVLIHDDDDSLDRCFLEKAIGYLERPSGRKYGGVITQSVYVSEQIDGDEVIVREHRPYNDWVRNVQIGEMLANNLFPPIAFLYRRSLYEDIGGYNETFPVLGDWLFNIEFLIRSDIGVLLEPLAYYHHRDQAGGGHSGAYANSVIEAQPIHEEYAAILRNFLFRKYADKNPAAVGILLGYVMERSRPAGGSPHKSLSHVATGSGSRATGGFVADGTLDRGWLVANINWLLAHRPRLGLVPRGHAGLLPPDSEWDEIEHAYSRFRGQIATAPDFDADAYVAKYADVASAIAAGAFDSAYDHYVLYGRKEGRERPRRPSG